ncbi:MAG: flagellar biosynthesis protein FlhA [Candidatus Desulfofervidaceae bacterium]|nr:flagellar biosynthesis protein FlhA [Candidatus Desulfofervidaceae bacterium]
MATPETLPQTILKRSDLLAAVGIVAILVVMVIPVPPFLLDILLTFNISFSLVSLLVAMYILKPLDFSVFPSLLLVATLFRLSLNIASTRLILLHGSEGAFAAGRVIHSFGQFVVGGNYVVGFIVFIILVVINFVVITKGAGRIAEVAARFTLDAMPGKQMSIDADLNAGLIDEAEARRRREMISHEADFYGAMDGASKFVRGDAIAGIIITLINIIGGLIIGVLQQGMPLAKAAKTYTILTVGDGLVSQIPALIVSTAAGVIVSRAASEANLGYDITEQLFTHPRAVLTAAFIVFGFGLMPGLPHLPFMLLGLAFGGIGYVLMQTQQRVEAEEMEEAEAPVEEEITEIPPLDPIGLEIGYRLISLVDASQGGDLLERIKILRKKYAQEMGFILPPVRIKDNLQLAPNAYAFLIKGVEVAKGELMVGYQLAIDPGNVKEKMEGIQTKEPVFGLPALWIPEKDVKQARALGYTVVDPGTVLITHFTEVIKQYCHELLDRQEVQSLLDTLRKTHPKVVDDLIPNVLSLGVLQKVLQNLLREQVPIRDLVTILETLADYAPMTKDPEVLTEYVRERLGRFIAKQYQSEDGILPVVMLDQEVETLIVNSLQQTELGAYPVLEPQVFNKLMAQVNKAISSLTSQGFLPIVLCSAKVRRHFKRLTERTMPNLVVLSYNEIPNNVKIKSLGIVRLENES